ncbi:MAG TPA: coenzyme F420-0:L-glutamate ligase [Nocardioidaceae bacterium]|nr:coenzyme F420-0:L-glutamate ligase [Nocardioidaceae bacterium]
MTELRVSAIDDLPEIGEGDDLAGLISARIGHELRTYDIVVVTSKVVSKAASLVTTADRESLIDDGTDRLVAQKGSTRIVRTHGGLTMAAAGLDASNTKPGTVVSLPPDPDADAARLRTELQTRHRDIEYLGVIVTDTAGRAWRIGQTDIAIGCAGIVPVRSYAGETDAYGNELFVTAPAIADEIASATELATGKLSGRPAAVVRGVDPSVFCIDDGPGARALVRAESEDLFGLGANEAVRQAVATTSDRPRGFADLDDDPLQVALEAVDPAVLDVGSTTSGISVGIVAGADHDTALMAIGALRERLRILDRAYGTRHEIHVRGL